LIELLIVVLIIAILAAIAVPNFLAFQTRAKIARVKSDFRTLATGQEAYAVDWGSYTNRDAANPNGRLQGWTQLSTPIAYITLTPIDPFGDSRYAQGNVDRLLPSTYELGTGKGGVGPSGTPWNPDVGFPSTTWEMNSSGPDKKEDTNNPGNTGMVYRFADARYPWVDIPADDPTAVIELLSIIYDPTNGTNSRGDVFRTGGEKPGGRMFDVFFEVTDG
jgi:type II secretory pathway pseudopilin PulG